MNDIWIVAQNFNCITTALTADAVAAFVKFLAYDCSNV